MSALRSEYLEYSTSFIGNAAPIKLNERGINAYKIESIKSERKQERENLELQKLRGDVEDITQRLADYDTVKSKAKTANIVSIVAAILTAIGLLLQWLLRNSD